MKTMAKANDWMLKTDRDLLAARQKEWRAWWEKTRSRGKLRFILVRYVLVLGGAMVLWNIAFESFSHPGSINSVQAKYVYSGWALTLLIAYLLGLWEWHSNEKRYQGKGL